MFDLDNDMELRNQPTEEEEAEARCAVAAGSRPFPIIPSYDRSTRTWYGEKTIPWELIAPHKRQAKWNHCGQSLATLARLGGLSRSEACAVLEDREWHGMSESAADAQLSKHVASFYANVKAQRRGPQKEEP